MDKIYNKLGLIGRFRPLHKGHVSLLQSTCILSQEVIIGIGSSNRYNYLNPFTVQEVKDMINISIGSDFKNYHIIEVPDYAQTPKYSNGEKWAKETIELFGETDGFISGNSFVKELLKSYYNVIDPKEITTLYVPVSSTYIRIAIARKDYWKMYVTTEIYNYITDNKIDKRIEREFGREILEKSNLGNDIQSEKDKIINDKQKVLYRDNMSFIEQEMKDYL